MDYEDVRDWVENGCPEGVSGMPENVQALLDAIADLRARNDALCDIIFRYVDPCDVLPEDDAVVAGAIAANREG